jgi:hypothetical protein
MLQGLLNDLANLNPLIVLAFLWITACLIWLACLLFASTRQKAPGKSRTDPERRRTLLLLYLGLAGPASVCALIAGGCFCLQKEEYGGYPLALHYLQPLIYTPLFFWPLLIPESALARIERPFTDRTWTELWIVGLLALAVLIGKVGVGERPAGEFVPEYVAKLDEITESRGLAHGLAYHWTARHINVFTTRNLKVLTVDGGFQLWPRFMNVDWAADTAQGSNKLQHPDFVIIGPQECYTRDMAIKHFGIPAEELSLGPKSGGRSVLIYD